MNDKSNIDLAYDVLKENYEKFASNKYQNLDPDHPFYPIKFVDLVGQANELSGETIISPEKASDYVLTADILSRFYTALTLDGRFVSKPDNTWALREHEAFKDVHIDMNEAYKDADKDDEEENKKAGKDNADGDSDAGEGDGSDDDSEEEKEESDEQKAYNEMNDGDDSVDENN